MSVSIYGKCIIIESNIVFGCMKIRHRCQAACYSLRGNIKEGNYTVSTIKQKIIYIGRIRREIIVRHLNILNFSGNNVA